jgi:hypothetical protein
MFPLTPCYVVKHFENAQSVFRFNTPKNNVFFEPPNHIDITYLARSTTPYIKVIGIEILSP